MCGTFLKECTPSSRYSWITANSKKDLRFEFERIYFENLVISNPIIDFLYSRIVQSWFVSIPLLDLTGAKHFQATILVGEMRVVLIRISNRARNRVCTSHTQCVTICDIFDGHKMSQFRICDIGHMLWIFVSFSSKTHLVTFWSQMVIHFKCDWVRKHVDDSQSFVHAPLACSQGDRNDPQYHKTKQHWYNLFLILFSKKMVLTKCNRQNIPERGLCFCCLFEIRIGTAQNQPTWFKMDGRRAVRQWWHRRRTSHCVRLSRSLSEKTKQSTGRRANARGRLPQTMVETSCCLDLVVPVWLIHEWVMSHSRVGYRVCRVMSKLHVWRCIHSRENTLVAPNMT